MNEMSFEAMRQAMVVSQLRTSAVDDPRVIAAMASLPRERFVQADRRAVAYVDRPVPLADGRALNPPATTALLLNAARVRAGERVLLVGSASGYTAALLAELGARVVALEEDARLIELAAVALADVRNVEQAHGPLAAGWPAGAPYDLLIVDGAVERLPDELTAQLVPDGRVATAMIDDGVIRLTLGRRAGGVIGYRAFADEEAVVLPGFEQPRGFRFP